MSKYLALVLLVASSAAAAEEQRVVVRLSASDLVATEAQLRTRLASAIEEVCGSYASVSPEMWWETDKCRQSAWASASRQVAELKARNWEMAGRR